MTNFIYLKKDNQVEIMGLEEDIEELVIPEKIDGYPVTAIGNSAFSHANIRKVFIPSSITSIGKSVFAGCNSLTSIVIDKDNKIYDSRDNCNAIIETSTNTLICGCKNTIIPDSVTSIGDYAFSGCRNLTSVVIPDSVTNIGSYAFYGCKNLTNVNIPNNVTKIRDCTFSFCENLTDIVLPKNVTYIGNFAFCECTKLTLHLKNKILITGCEWAENVKKVVKEYNK